MLKLGNEFCIVKTSEDTTYTLQSADKLTVMMNNTITQIDIREEKLFLHKEFECFGCAYAIFRVQNDYIVFGEIEILRLDEKFNALWRFSGRDIFVSMSGKNTFELCEDRIKLYDWQDNYYELDYNGNLICDIPSNR